LSAGEPGRRFRCRGHLVGWGVYPAVFCILRALPVNLESPLPAALPAGSAVALYCSGTADHDGSPVTEFRFVVAGQPHPADAVRMPRFDMPCRRSGFWGIVPVQATPGDEAIVLGAEFRSGPAAWQQVELGRIAISAPHPAAGTADPELIAICMGTFNPDPGLLERQLDSIRNQTDSRWTCVISDDFSDPEPFDQLVALTRDDPRFTVSRAPSRIGFYRNFERALELAPPGASLIALCDQDDVWHPHKLETLRRGLGSATLVYSDQRLVDDRGRLLRDTLWKGRANNWTNLASMLIANTVTGAAALFRRPVAELALPFPDSPGIEFHDHWVALSALASGELRYVDRPLYDYVQHEAAVLGKVATGAGRRGRSRRSLRQDWRAAYFLGHVPAKVRAHTLLVRSGRQLAPAKRRALERYLAADRSLLALAWLLLRPLRALLGRNETLGTEWELARGVVWFRLARALARSPWQRLQLDARFPDPPHFEQRRLQRWRARM
jgi:glycosyltransferase involved in cell wall biosynthesis